MITIEDKMKEDLQKLSDHYKALEKEEFILALRANTTTEQAEHGQAYSFYHKLSETYRLMSLKTDDYTNQFPGV